MQAHHPRWLEWAITGDRCQQTFERLCRNMKLGLEEEDEEDEGSHCNKGRLEGGKVKTYISIIIFIVI